jgi:cyanophycin synthetase
MPFEHVRCLRGPNRWAGCPVVVVSLSFSDEWACSSTEIQQTIDCLETELLDRKVAALVPQGPPLRPLALAFGLAALKLQQMAGAPVSFAEARMASPADHFLVAVEFAEESVGKAAAEDAWQLLQSAHAKKHLALQEHLARLRQLAYQQRLPASTAAIYHAARARGVPVARLSPEYGRYLVLGQGAKQHRCLASETDAISAVARSASTDKYLAKQLLQAAGVPVPQGRLVATAEEAWDAARDLGLPVAIKPQDSDLATGVSLDLRTRDQVETGFRCANEHSTWALVERFAPGTEHRVLVVDDRVVAVTRIDPPHVVGDGTSTVAQLVAQENRSPRRGSEASGAPLSLLKIDEVAQTVLAAQGQAPDSIPAAGQQVLVRRNPPYFKNGGNLVDLTDAIHPSIAAHAVAAAQAVQLRVAGLDVVAVDIRKPLEEQGGVVVEINAGPGLWLHMAPWADSPRPIGEAIVGSLFPPGEEGRVPVVALVGERTSSAQRHLTALLTHSGLRVGSASSSEITVGERRWPTSADSPQERAGTLLRNPIVDVALLLTTPRELLQVGFGNDRCNVALVMGPGASAAVAAGPISAAGIVPHPSEFIDALQHALVPKGMIVIAADEELSGPEPGLSPARVILVTLRSGSPRVQRHVDAGGPALMVQQKGIFLARGSGAPIRLGRCPDGGSEEDNLGLLAALAGGFALGQPVETLQSYLYALR